MILHKQRFFGRYGGRTFLGQSVWLGQVFEVRLSAIESQGQDHQVIDNW